MNHKNSKFCVLPFMSLATDTYGNFRFCCISSNDDGYLLDNTGRRMNIQHDELNSVWNSQRYIEIRRQMLSDQEPTACSRCFDQERSGVLSPRFYYNKQWYDSGEQYRVDQPLNIRYINLRLGNLCNIKCRMCGPAHSNLWIKEYQQLFGHDSQYPETNWPLDEQVWGKLRYICDQVEELHFVGGEPTVVKEHIQLLDYLISNNRANQVSIKYNTNLVKISDTLVNKWKHFKRVQVNCSIDGYQSVNDYIRHPSKWSTIERNFDRLQSEKNIVLDIVCTVQNYNILNLSDLIDWFKSKSMRRYYFNVLEKPRYYNIRCLPPELKTLAESKLQKHISDSRVQSVIKFMNSQDRYSDHFDEFIDITNRMDSLRGENILDVCPDFKSYWK